MLQKMGRRAISLPITIIAEAPSFEVVYELEKVKKVYNNFVCVCVCVRVCVCMCE